MQVSNGQIFAPPSGRLSWKLNPVDIFRPCKYVQLTIEPRNKEIYDQFRALIEPVLTGTAQNTPLWVLKSSEPGEPEPMDHEAVMASLRKALELKQPIFHSPQKLDVGMHLTDALHDLLRANLDTQQDLKLYGGEVQCLECFPMQVYAGNICPALESIRNMIELQDLYLTFDA